QDAHERRLPRPIGSQQAEHARPKLQGKLPQSPEVPLVQLPHSLDRELHGVHLLAKTLREKRGEVTAGRLASWLEGDILSADEAETLPGNLDCQLPDSEAEPQSDSCRPPADHSGLVGDSILV